MIKRVTKNYEKYFVEVYIQAYKGLEEYAYTNRRDVKWYFRWLLRRDQNGFFTYILDIPVGFIACDCNWFSVFENDEVAEIHEIVVHPNWQGRGIGKALMKMALEYARERDKSTVELWVGVSNHRAINFYRKFGFDLRGIFGRWLRMTLKL